MKLDHLIERHGYLRKRRHSDNRSERPSDPRRWNRNSTEDREERAKRENSNKMLPDDQQITAADIGNLEYYLDRLYAENDIDFAFTNHFRKQINIDRNGRPITVKDLINVFTRMHDKYGAELADNVNIESVLKDMRDDINCPFIIIPDRKDGKYKLVVKTAMRTDRFRIGSNQKVFTV